MTLDTQSETAPSVSSLPKSDMLYVDLQIASTSKKLPEQMDFQHWIQKALSSASSTPDREYELSIRLVDHSESQQLNNDYRGKDNPTNVLSFPADLPPELNLPLLGDLVICAPVVESEALEQQKSLSAHWAHMTVHGTLHLLGFDHIDDNDAEIMEALETQILIDLGYPPPYDAPS